MADCLAAVSTTITHGFSEFLFEIYGTGACAQCVYVVSPNILIYDHKTSQQRRVVFVIVHDRRDTSLAAVWTLSETNCCLAELMANCSKLTVHGTQNFAVPLTSSPSVTEYIE